MIIGVDGNEANVAEKVGVSVYTLEMLRYFQKNSSKNIQFEVYLREKPRSDLPSQTAYFRYNIVRGTRLWRDVIFPLYLFLHHDIDVLFCPAHYAPRFCPVPFVVTVHDTSYLYFQNEFLKKDLYKLTSWTRHAVKHAAKIVAVSRSTKKDVLKNYRVSTEKVRVIYNGFGRTKQSEKDIQSTFSLPGSPYILYVGTVQPRKNIPTLIKAFKKYRMRHPKNKLVIVGKMGWLFGSIFDKVLEMGLENDIVFTGYVSNSQLSALYKKALCFVFPSLYEGFGIPLLEAMSHECPVVASRASSLPEIGGDACVYFNPKSATDLDEKIEAVAHNAALRKTLVEKGLKRVQSFSWEKSAQQTLATLMKACQSS